MRKNFLKILTIVLLVVVQLAFLSKISFFTFMPNFIFLISLVLLFRGLIGDSFLVATVGGLLLDLASPFRFGFYTLIFISILLFCHFVILKNMPTLSPLLVFGLCWAIFILIDLIICWMVHLWPTWQIVIDSTLNGLCGLLIYFFFEKFTKKEEINVNI